MTLDEIRPTYGFDESCQGTVPQAISAFLESEDVEDAIRNAISLGGDSDTLACITGGIAQAFYGGVPEFITQKVMEILDKNLRKITSEFMEVYLQGMKGAIGIIFGSPPPGDPKNRHIEISVDITEFSR